MKKVIIIENNTEYITDTLAFVEQDGSKFLINYSKRGMMGYDSIELSDQDIDAMRMYFINKEK